MCASLFSASVVSRSQANRGISLGTRVHSYLTLPTVVYKEDIGLCMQSRLLGNYMTFACQKLSYMR